MPRIEELTRKFPEEKVLLGFSTSVSIPELAGLNPDEVEFIDSVIQRAPATATTFLTVLKVYNDLLLERGLDPQNEVVYFGKLLKLGTVKGQTWRDKWNIIKDRHGYNARIWSWSPRHARSDPPSATPGRSGRTDLYKPPLTFQRPNPEYDAFTLHSSQTEGEIEPTQSTSTGGLGPQYHTSPQRLEPSALVSTPGTPIPATLAGGNRYHYRVARDYIPSRWDSQGSDYTDSAPTRVSTPPSYGAVVHEFPPPSTVKTPYFGVQTRGPFTRPHQEKHTIIPPKPMEPPQNVIDEDDVWVKVREARDEVEADKFREAKLVERCWDIWLQGVEWVQVRTTSRNEMHSDDETFEDHGTANV